MNSAKKNSEKRAEKYRKNGQSRKSSKKYRKSGLKTGNYITR